MDEKIKRVRKFLTKASDVGEAALSPVLSKALESIPWLIGYAEPTSAVLMKLGKLLFDAALEQSGRQLSGREASRGARSLVLAVSEIRDRLDSGGEVRDDGFFRLRTGESCRNAEMLIDGVVTKAKSQYEEEKIQYIANVLAATVFDESISPDEACWILSLMDQLTYLQLIIMAKIKTMECDELNDAKMPIVVRRNPLVASQIHALRSMGLLTEQGTFSMDIWLTPIGCKLISAGGVKLTYGDPQSEAVSTALSDI